MYLLFLLSVVEVEVEVDWGGGRFVPPPAQAYGDPDTENQPLPFTPRRDSVLQLDELVLKGDMNKQWSKGLCAIIGLSSVL